MFPERLTDHRAYEVAQALLEGFNRHYRLFRDTSAAAQQRFEQADWLGQQRAQRERIEFYDTRVDEAAERLQAEFAAGTLSMDVWQQVKLHYIGLLTNHHQPELAETFFNSVTTKILHHQYFNNDFIFVRPAVSTEYIENDEPAARPTFRAWYPTPTTLRDTLADIVASFGLQGQWENFDRDIDQWHSAVLASLGGERWRTNAQFQVLASPFFRNKGAYLVGKIINGDRDLPFALPILHAENTTAPGTAAASAQALPPAPGPLTIDAALFGEDDLQMLFSFARAYFLVAMEVPSAYVQFLRTLMPRKPRSEIYSALGLQKQGKALFFRDFQFHLRHSSDAFRIAPGIKGMVMLVFDLPSYPYVFKLIKDFFPAPKETTREQVKGKYLLVKQHDRVGRMADTLEFSNVALPRSRFTPQLLAEIQRFCPSLVDDPGEHGETLILRHVYIERRMIPLNIFLQEAAPAQLERAVIEYGNAIKDLVAANIFPGDMLWKNFGVMRHGKVVFYDYDEIEYITDCNFRRVPPPRNEEEEMSGEVWYSVRPGDVFPETFGPFLLGHAAVREVFMRHHGDLLDAAFWQQHQARIRAGHVHDVFPYDPERRFCHQRRSAAAVDVSAAEDVAP